jgi:hypothetical protein
MAGDGPKDGCCSGVLMRRRTMTAAPISATTRAKIEVNM